MILADLSAEKGEAEAKRLAAAGGKATFCNWNVASDESIDAFAKAVLGRGEVHILVNCAGFGKGQPFVENERPYMSKVLEINLMGPIKLTRALLDPMIARQWQDRGDRRERRRPRRLVGRNRLLGCQGRPHLFSKGLAREMARHSINVNCVCPVRPRRRC